MANYNETSKAVKDGLAEIMKMESVPDEAIQKMTAVLDNMKNLDKTHQEVVDKCLDYRDKYVKSITNFGTTENATEEKKGRTMEEIYNDVVNKK